jgi:hypothetical protein
MIHLKTNLTELVKFVKVVVARSLRLGLTRPGCPLRTLSPAGTCGVRKGRSAASMTYAKSYNRNLHRATFFLCESDGKMDIGEILQIRSREEWREWLAGHHQEVQEIWLVLNKSSSGPRGLTMPQAQEEALCFGWVDSTLKPIDESSYALRFSPRHRLSRWGRSNRARALKMLRAGKMTSAGMDLLPPEVLRIWEKESLSCPPPNAE